MATSRSTPLIAVVGQTATGKSALALELAGQFDGEIICADARTIYKGMDIGTAKPSQSDLTKVRHHVIDVVRPDERFTAADFQKLALAAIDDIGSRGKLPIMVGGTGLYTDSVLFGYSFLPAPDEKMRIKLQHMSPKELMLELDSLGITYDHVDAKNPRRLQRLIETRGQTPKRQPLRPQTLVIGLDVPRSELRRRIEQRIEAMFRAGFLDEVRTLLETYPSDLEAFRAPGHKPAIDYLAGNISKRQAKAQFLANDLNLAKRQRTWFKRNPEIKWVEDTAEAISLTEAFVSGVPQSATIKPITDSR